jgi:hypothetical protein
VHYLNVQTAQLLLRDQSSLHNSTIWKDDFVCTEDSNVACLFMYMRAIRATLQFAASVMAVKSNTLIHRTACNL